MSYAQEEYKFGVFPHMPLNKLHEVFSSVTQDLEKEIGTPIRLMSKPYYKYYTGELNKGLYDIAFIQPLDYPQAHEKQGYIPIARRGEDLKALLVVLNTSSFKDVDDVKSKVIASAPSGAAVTEMMMRSLHNDGFQVMDNFTLSYSKNHFICLQKVIEKKASACITAKRALNFFNQEVGKGNKFRIIYETRPLPHALFVVHPRVSSSVREIIKKRILAWNADTKGKELLRKGRLLQFVEAKDQDYDVVRQFLDMSN